MSLGSLNIFKRFKKKLINGSLVHELTIIAFPTLKIAQSRALIRQPYLEVKKYLKTPGIPSFHVYDSEKRDVRKIYYIFRPFILFQCSTSQNFFALYIRRSIHIIVGFLLAPKRADECAVAKMHLRCFLWSESTDNSSSSCSRQSNNHNYLCPSVFRTSLKVFDCNHHSGQF